ncbi:MazG nucleotide pyrophosphohydrolase domain-containing protein [uncultured Corynebacterium sp.]|uniref:MazG nucleotide pyrophosphohydrolase domain-containing protein n=1 Tax=uncultured Corynebacterium sp. TaxID=159447 RepID=UPI0025D7A04D|nr:MazG nucleotide pyrophosphohydrolase domain-containing protein [uncultured Corynebacterium sp.]
MSVVLLDPRFPAMIPVEAVDLLRGDVCYTEEVPIRVRWVIADLGGHTVDESDIIVTTDLENEAVVTRIEADEDLITAPSLKVHMEPTRELEAGSSSISDATNGEDEAGISHSEITHSGDGVVDGEIVGTDEHTATVAGLRRTTRTEVPASVMDEIEDAVALMARALRQGEWEQSMTHTSLVKFLREETEELARTIDLMENWKPEGEGQGATRPEWIEQELCAELSDVLLQVLFHAEIANRRGAFDIGHVAGAFSAKLRARAPYLFEEVERQVPRQEQDRLWAEGKKEEEAQRIRSFGDEYLRYSEAKKEAEQKAAEKPAESVQSRQEPHAEQFPAVHAPTAAAGSAVPASSGASADPADSAGTTGTAVGSAGTSALTAAEAVIAEARQLGISDKDIPTDIRYPMVGLELDSPGEAERRLHDAVAAFREKLRSQQHKPQQRHPQQPGIQQQGN